MPAKLDKAQLSAPKMSCILVFRMSSGRCMSTGVQLVCVALVAAASLGWVQHTSSNLHAAHAPHLMGSNPIESIQPSRSIKSLRHLATPPRSHFLPGQSLGPLGQPVPEEATLRSPSDLKAGRSDSTPWAHRPVALLVGFCIVVAAFARKTLQRVPYRKDISVPLSRRSGASLPLAPLRTGAAQYDAHVMAMAAVTGEPLEPPTGSDAMGCVHVSGGGVKIAV